jgi:predicted nucleic acid-binding protein
VTTVDTNLLLHASGCGKPVPGGGTHSAESTRRRIQLSTRVGVFRNPLPPATAIDAVERLIERRHIRVLGEVTGAVKARGNLISDVHIAALMRQHGVREIWTHDRDFRRFDGIVVRDPFDVPPQRQR